MSNTRGNKRGMSNTRGNKRGMSNTRGNKRGMSLSMHSLASWAKRTVVLCLAVATSATFFIASNTTSTAYADYSQEELSKQAETGTKILPAATPARHAIFYSEDGRPLVANTSLPQDQQNAKNQSWNQVLVSGDKVIEPALPPQKPYYIFDHWALKPENSSQSNPDAQVTPGVGSPSAPASSQDDSWKNTAYNFDTVQKFNDSFRTYHFYPVYRHAYLINFIIRSSDLDEKSPKDVVIASYTENRFCKPETGMFENSSKSNEHAVSTPVPPSATSPAVPQPKDSSSDSSSTEPSDSPDDPQTVNSCKFGDYEKYVRPFLSSGKYVAGWTDDRHNKENYVHQDTPITKSTNFYVTIKQGYELSFAAQKGSNTPSWYGDTKTNPKKPQDPERDGYDFKGWSSQKNTYTPFNFNKPLTKNTVAYAFWTPKETSITFVTKIEDVLDKHGQPLPLSYDAFAMQGLQDNDFCSSKSDCKTKGGSLVLVESSANTSLPPTGIKDAGQTSTQFQQAVEKTKKAAQLREGQYVLQSVDYKEHMPQETTHFTTGETLSQPQLEKLASYCVIPRALNGKVDAIVEAPKDDWYTQNGLAGDGTSTFTCKLRRKRVDFTYYVNNPIGKYSSVSHLVQNKKTANEQRQKLYAIRFYGMLLGDNNQFPGENLKLAVMFAHKLFKKYLPDPAIDPMTKRESIYSFWDSQVSTADELDLYNMTALQDKETPIGFTHPSVLADSGANQSVNIIGHRTDVKSVFLLVPFEVGNKYLLSKNSTSFDVINQDPSSSLPASPTTALTTDFLLNMQKYHMQVFDRAACIVGACSSDYQVFKDGTVLNDEIYFYAAPPRTGLTIQDHFPLRGYKQYFFDKVDYRKSVYYKGRPSSKMWGPSCDDDNCTNFKSVQVYFDIHMNSFLGKTVSYGKPKHTYTLISPYQGLKDKFTNFLKDDLNLDYTQQSVYDDGRGKLRARHRIYQPFPYKRLSYRAYFKTNSDIENYNTLIPYNFSEKQAVEANYDAADDRVELSKAKGLQQYLKKFVIGKTVRQSDKAVFKGWTALRDDSDTPHQFGTNPDWHMPAFDTVIVAVWEKPKYRLRVFCQAKSNKICFTKDYTVGTTVNKMLYDNSKQPPEHLTDETQSTFIQWLWRRAPKLGFKGEKVDANTSHARAGSWRKLDVNGDVVMNSNIDVRPQYRLEQLTIKYHPGLVNDQTQAPEGPQGTGTMEQGLLYKPNTYPQIKDNGFTPPAGYYFAGWKVKDAFSKQTPRYKQPGDFVQTYTTGMNTDGVIVSADVYAIWKQIPRATITYHANYPNEIANEPGKRPSDPQTSDKLTTHITSDYHHNEINDNDHRVDETILRNDKHIVQGIHELQKDDWSAYAADKGYRFIGWSDRPNTSSSNTNSNDIAYVPYNQTTYYETNRLARLNDRHHNDLYAVWKKSYFFYVKKVGFNPSGGQEKLLDGAQFKLSNASFGDVLDGVDDAIEPVVTQEKVAQPASQGAPADASAGGEDGWKPSAQFRVNVDTDSEYDLAEVMAPFGYELQPQSININVDGEGNVTLGNYMQDGANASVKLYKAMLRTCESKTSCVAGGKPKLVTIIQITDFPTSTLPLAGSMGVWVYLLIGVIAMGAGLTAQYLNKRSSTSSTLPNNQ